MTAMATALTPPLNFIHIPKTGGTTVRGVVELHYPTHRAAGTALVKREMEKQGEPKERMTFGADLAKIWLYQGHTNVTSVLPEGYRRFTVVREPVARLRSQFHHWVAWTRKEIEDSPSAPNIKALKHRAKTSTLEEFLAFDEGPVFRLFRNGQCKTLVSNFPYQEHHRLKGEELVEQVCRNLDGMLTVGVTERLDESMRVLCWKLGWPPPPRVERLNARKRNREGDAAALPPIMEEAVVLDRRAYEHAMSRFERDHSAMLNDLSLAPGADADHVIAALDARARLALIESGVEPADEIHARMDSGLRGSGWHELEHARTGHTYRWTGPSTRTTLDLLIRPAEAYEVWVSVVSLLHRDVLKGTRVRVNGVEPDRCTVEWRLPFSDQDPATHRLRAIVSGHPVGDDGFCRIEILVPKTFRADDVEPGCGDTREKGLAITRVHLTPRP